MPTLFAEGVTAGYGRVPIINDITLAADIGSVTTIVGPNGAGKSTFAKTLVGILKPMSGRITVNDFDITTIPGHQIPRRGLVYVPQNDNVFKRLTVRENLEVGGFASKGDTSARMQEVLGIFADLGEAVEKKAGFLSGGQQNLLAIARALMVDPSVIILDEPMAGVNPALIERIGGYILDLKESGVTVLMVEHNLNVVEQICDYVIVLAEGRTLATGRLSELRENAEVVKAYLGEVIDASALH